MFLKIAAHISRLIPRPFFDARGPRVDTLAGKDQSSAATSYAHIFHPLWCKIMSTKSVYITLKDAHNAARAATNGWHGIFRLWRQCIFAAKGKGGVPMAFAKRHGLMESQRVMMIRTHCIRPNPRQPRKMFDAENLRELSESIRLYGVLQPLTVRRLENGAYELIAGERRLRASRLAGLDEVPCILLGVDEKQSALIALIENLQRCDLDFFEEAEGIQRLIRQFGLSQEEAARRIGKSQSALANKLRILRHPPEIIADIREYGLTERHARALLRLEDLEDRKVVMDTIIARRLNVAQTDEYIDAYLTTLPPATVGVSQLPPEDRPPPEAPSEPEPARDKIRTLYVFKDVRLFLNTVNRAVDVVRQAGIPAGLEREEVGDEIVLTIKVPKRV